MKLQVQKKPCIGYSRHSINSCRAGVVAPTMKLKAQFVAVDIDTPLARTMRGMIYRPVSVEDQMERISSPLGDTAKVGVPSYMLHYQQWTNNERTTLPISKGGIENDDTYNNSLWRCRYINVHPPTCCSQCKSHLYHNESMELGRCR
jgi:hypothetical protein